MPERSADWLTQATRDLEAARHNLTGEFYEWTCFACQQAAEKALKAVFQHSHEHVWGHRIVDMLDTLGTNRTITEDVLEAGRRLDRYYVQPRYPDGFDAGAPMDYYGQSDAGRAITDAETILRVAHDLVSGRPEDHPDAPRQGEPVA